MNLAYLRARAERALTDTCVISVPAGYISDGKGGRKPIAPSTATYACQLTERSGSIERGAIQVERGAYKLRLPWAAVVKAGDTIALLGRTFVVKFAPPAKAEAHTRSIGIDEAG
jgi:hypothetical protein